MSSPPPLPKRQLWTLVVPVDYHRATFIRLAREIDPLHTCIDDHDHPVVVDDRWRMRTLSFAMTPASMQKFVARLCTHTKQHAMVYWLRSPEFHVEVNADAEVE